MRMPARSSAVLLITVLSLAVVATGCLESDVDVTIDKDGSGQVEVEVFLTNAVQQALQGVDVEAVVDGAFESVDGAEFEPISSGGREGYRLYVPFDDYQQLSEVLVAGGTVAGQQVSLFSSFRLLELSSGGWELSATVNPLGQILSSAQSGEIPLTIDELLDAAGVGAAGTGLDLTIALPGEVTTSNADEVDGGSATWNLDAPDAPTELRMRTVPKPLLSPLLVVVLGAAAVVLIGVVLALMGASRPYHRTEGDRRRRTPRGRQKRRRRRGAAEPASAWAASGDSTPSAWAAEPDAGLPALSEVPAAPPLSAPDVATVGGPDGDSAAGSIRAAATAEAVPPGWYPDPEGAAALRWWDGTDWTEHRS